MVEINCLYIFYFSEQKRKTNYICTLNIVETNDLYIFIYSKQKRKTNCICIMRGECTNLGIESNQIKFDYK